MLAENEGHRGCDVFDRCGRVGKRRMAIGRLVHHPGAERGPVSPDVEGIDNAAGVRESRQERVPGKRQIEQRRTECRAVDDHNRRVSCSYAHALLSPHPHNATGCAGWPQFKHAIFEHAEQPRCDWRCDAGRPDME